MCAEEENKKTEATVEQEHATGLYQVMPPQSREASETSSVAGGAEPRTDVNKLVAYCVIISYIIFLFLV